MRTRVSSSSRLSAPMAARRASADSRSVRSELTGGGYTPGRDGSRQDPGQILARRPRSRTVAKRHVARPQGAGRHVAGRAGPRTLRDAGRPQRGSDGSHTNRSPRNSTHCCRPRWPPRPSRSASARPDSTPSACSLWPSSPAPSSRSARSSRRRSAPGPATCRIGLVRLLAGLAFSLGLILVIVGGAELFTGNTLIVMAWASGKVGSGHVLRNWSIVYVGNLVGALATVASCSSRASTTFGNGASGRRPSRSGTRRRSRLRPGDRARDDVQRAGLPGGVADLQRPDDDRPDPRDRAADRRLRRRGFEHSVANMYFIPEAIVIRTCAPDRLLGRHRPRPADYPNLTSEASGGQPAPGDHREHHRRRADGWHRLLVRLPPRGPTRRR